MSSNRSNRCGAFSNCTAGGSFVPVTSVTYSRPISSKQASTGRATSRAGTATLNSYPSATSIPPLTQPTQPNTTPPSTIISFRFILHLSRINPTKQAPKYNHPPHHFPTDPSDFDGPAPSYFAAIRTPSAGRIPSNSPA